MSDLLGLPLEVSTHAHYIDNIIVIVHYLMAVLFIGWGAFFVYSLVRFRKKRSPVASYAGVRSHFSTYLEVGIAIFEGFLLVGLAVPVWSSVVTAYPSEKDALVIHVIGEQFAWNAHYAGADGVFGRRDVKLVSPENPIGLDRSDPAGKDDITTINQLNLPVNKRILIRLSSKDVIHSFGIPLLRVKQDAIPGESVPVTFVASMTSAEVQQALTHTYRIAGGNVPVQLKNMVARAEYKDKDGNVILAVGDQCTEDIVAQLLAAGITEVRAGSDTPVEVACSQLCGLGHYRMRATVNLQTEEDYKAWLAEEASYLEE